MFQRNGVKCVDPSCSRLLATLSRGPHCHTERSVRLNHPLSQPFHSMSTDSDTRAEVPLSKNVDEDTSSLSRAELIKRVNNLQAQLQSQTAKIAALTAAKNETSLPPRRVGREPKASSKTFDPNRYCTRKIALKIAYLGHRYNGFEHANGTLTPRPTIEEALWKALRKVKLIFPPIADGADEDFEVIFDEGKRDEMYYKFANEHPKTKHGKVRLELNWDGCEYSKCGRTDRGVSAFGQVISIRVRSNRLKPKGALTVPDEVREDVQNDVSWDVSGLPVDTNQECDPVEDELPYISMLNTVLPSDIRVLAWCPNPPEDFSARTSCEERRYKYFFTNPAFCPTPGRLGLFDNKGQRQWIREGWLDIERMKRAAKKLEGLHDYRNFCRIDGSKQMPKCDRNINFADIEEVEYNLDEIVDQADLNAAGEASHIESVSQPTSMEASRGSKVYAFTVHGSAFLWHQVRCMVAILFLVGQGLEQPEIVDELLDIGRNPARPDYKMADDAPLVLWDCVFTAKSTRTKDGLKWLYAGDAATMASLSSSKVDGKFGLGGVVNDLWKQWQEAKLKEAQLAGLLGMVIRQGDGTSLERGGYRNPASLKLRSQKVFEGTGTPRLVGTYQPVMQKPLLGTLEETNSRYVNGKKARRNERKAQVSKTSG